MAPQEPPPYQFSRQHRPDATPQKRRDPVRGVGSRPPLRPV